MQEAELTESLWLCTIDGIGRNSVMKLWKQTGDFKKIASLSEQELKSCIGAKKTAAFLAANTEQARKTAYQRLCRYWEKGISFLPVWHTDYPQRLCRIADPPAMLFVKGKLPVQKQLQAAVIGARACSAYGSRAARVFARELAQKGIGIVSGMARGIDSIAQQAALEVSQSSIAVLGCGVDICYPPENRQLYDWLEQGGALVSEYLPGTKPQSYMFPPRNRIISGLSDLVLVVEAREKSGTLITVDMALEQGKEVFAVPGRVLDVCSRGCNRLIANGAGIATEPDAVLEALRQIGVQNGLTGITENGICENPIMHREDTGELSKSKGCDSDCTADLRKKILDALSSEFLSLDELAAHTQLPVFEVMQTVTHLYMEGILQRQCGRYCKKI